MSDDTCLLCGREMGPTAAPNRVYCSLSCKSKAKRARYRTALRAAAELARPGVERGCGDRTSPSPLERSPRRASYPEPHPMQPPSPIANGGEPNLSDHEPPSSESDFPHRKWPSSDKPRYLDGVKAAAALLAERAFAVTVYQTGAVHVLWSGDVDVVAPRLVARDPEPTGAPSFDARGGR